MRYLPFLCLALTCCAQAPQTPSVAQYDRQSWGSWVDADENCRDTRQEILIRDSTEPVDFDDRGCRVMVGSWTCPYTGEVTSDPRVVDIDHVVSLKEAHVSGAHSWDDWAKSLFYNHSSNLRAVSRSANRSKGARDPAKWLPPNEGFRCQYIKDWLAVKDKWNLEMDCDETQAISSVAAQYCF